MFDYLKQGFNYLELGFKKTIKGINIIVNLLLKNVSQVYETIFNRFKKTLNMITFIYHLLK